MKHIKEHLKEKHGDHFQDCNFEVKEFNLHKRKLEGAEGALANKPTGGKGKGGGTGTSGSGGGTGGSGSGGTIFLDFTGHLVTGTSWNFNGDILCSPANLTSTQVDEIVLNVTNEYSPFNVTVTTDESVYNSTDKMKRMRLILTETWEWYGQSGGVALIGSFTWGDNTPCFVFTSLLNYNTKFIKEAAAHEIGHTMGLYHQSKYDANCVKISDYNSGDGITAPIMGVGYYVPDEGSKWWIGPNTYGCANIQDDFQILKTNLGLK